MKKKERSGPEADGPVVKVPLFKSLWEDEGRRALSILTVFSALCILLVLAINTFYSPAHKPGEFSGLLALNSNYERILMPIGFLLALLSLLLFSISGTYGHYTQATLGKRVFLAKSTFRKLSFYAALFAAILLLSGGIVSSVAGISP